ncbi:MAG TPA: hypothetical protein VHN11_20925 [Xanthobacteraceae bacterium]|jgi:hypothetical protein|nr:hypothetical protein [Xanthobacteraceae bacterium]
MQRFHEMARSVFNCLLAGLFLTIAVPALADEIGVEAVNASTPTLCAETDNVTVKLMSTEVRHFIIEAEHPAYIGTLLVDRAAPDFRHCDMSSDPSNPSTPRRVTLYETEEWQLVGLTFPNFWRKANVPVRVGGRVESGLHLIQLWKRYQERAEEVLVVYPADGYWRARPLPPAHLRWTAYGSSFLLGPIETDGRLLVDIRAISFEPSTRTFHIEFARGGAASLHLASLDQERIVLDVNFDRTIGDGRPFAALRSMYVTDVNADAAQFAWRSKDFKGWKQSPIMSFDRAHVQEIWAGRVVPSRHNTSAPDMIFRGFENRNH